MTNQKCDFTFSHYAYCLQEALRIGYSIRRAGEVSAISSDGPVLILRHDVDGSPERAMEFAAVENALNVTATYYWRVVANEYNAFGYEAYSSIADLRAAGHEIGLHAEPLDFEAATGLRRERSLEFQVAAFRLLLGTDEPLGVASHNDQTPDNNLDFLTEVDLTTYGISYEAYGRPPSGLFHRSQYVTDSLGKWRRFDQGVLTEDDRCLCRQIASRPQLLYVLTHPHNWYRKHFHRVRY